MLSHSSLWWMAQNGYHQQPWLVHWSCNQHSSGVHVIYTDAIDTLFKQKFDSNFYNKVPHRASNPFAALGGFCKYQVEINISMSLLVTDRSNHGLAAFVGSFKGWQLLILGAVS